MLFVYLKIHLNAFGGRALRKSACSNGLFKTLRIFEVIQASKMFNKNYSIDECLSLFGCSPVITVVNKRKVKFLADYLTAYASCLLVLHKRNLMHCRVTA